MFIKKWAAFNLSATHNVLKIFEGYEGLPEQGGAGRGTVIEDGRKHFLLPLKAAPLLSKKDTVYSFRNATNSLWEM